MTACHHQPRSQGLSSSSHPKKGREEERPLCHDIKFNTTSFPGSLFFRPQVGRRGGGLCHDIKIDKVLSAFILGIMHLISKHLFLVCSKQYFHCCMFGGIWRCNIEIRNSKRKSSVLCWQDGVPFNFGFFFFF